MPEIDLENGDPDRAERIAKVRGDQEAGQARSRAARASSKSEKSDKPSATKAKSSSTGTTDANLKSRLRDAFVRLADQRETKDDTELSLALREEADAMAQGLVSLTRNITPLRFPLLFVLNFLEPVLAFWRVGGILLGRFATRRNLIEQEREMARADAVQASQPVAAAYTA